VRGLVIRWAIGAFSLWLASTLIPGVAIEGVGTFFLAAILLGFVNAVVRPVIFFLTLPFTIFSLGLFLLVINAAMLGLVAALLEGFTLSGFWAALFGSLVVTVTGWLASRYIGPKGRFEFIVIDRRGNRD
jgi:putative membrane protein